MSLIVYWISVPSRKLLTAERMSSVAPPTTLPSLSVAPPET
jgi:hypothetical protein